MSDDVFRGMHFEKKNHFALCSKKKQNKEKKQIFSLVSLSLFFSLFSLKVSSQRKTSSHLSRCSRFHHLKRKTHLSSLRAQFRAHTSSRAEERHPPLCCSLFLQYYYKECFERKEREKRARCLWLYCCVHRFDWRKKHAQVINESTSHCFFFPKANLIAHPIDRRRTVASRKSLAGRVVGSCARVRQESERRRMPARRTTTTTLEKTKKNIMNTTNTTNHTDVINDEEKTPQTKKGEKKKQKSQQKQRKCLSREEKKNVQKRSSLSSSFSRSSLLYSKDPLKTLQTSEEDKEEFVNFLLKEEEEEEDNDTISLQVSMQFVRDAVREYPGVKLNKELLEDTEAALAFFGGGDRGGGFFIEEEEEEDDDDTGNENELKQPRRRLQNFLKLEDFEEMIDETTGARTVLLTIPSSKEEDAATTKRTVLLNTLKISEQNREIGEREERARREDLLEAKKKLVSQANTTAAAKGKTTSSGGVGKKKAGTKSSAAAIKKKKDDDEGEMKIGGEDKDEDKQEEKDEISPDGDDILSGSCAATRRFNSGKFQLDQSKKIHGAIADDKVFKFLREFKKEVYETYRLRSLVEKMDFSSDDDMNQKSDDRENVLECIRIWINMRGMVVSARLALIEREKFLKDCEAMTKFASDYRKDTKAVSKAPVPTEKATTVVAPSKMKATDATTTTILKEIPTYSIANRSLSSWSILLNEDDEALLDDEYVEKNDIDDDIDDDDNQHVLTIEDQLESEIKTYEQEQTFNQMIIKGHLAHVTPAGEEFRDATAKLEKALEKILRSPSLSTKTSHDRDRLLASTKWSADQTMVFDDLILLCDNAYFPSNEKACKAADDINRHVLYRAVSVLKKAFEILSDFVDKDLVVGGFKKSAARLFSSTLEQTYRRQFSNMLNNILDPYDTLIDYGAETKLLMFVRMRVTNAMEIDSALRERAHQTVISACLEQMLSGNLTSFRGKRRKSSSRSSCSKKKRKKRRRRRRKPRNRPPRRRKRRRRKATRRAKIHRRRSPRRRKKSRIKKTTTRKKKKEKKEKKKNKEKKRLLLLLLSLFQSLCKSPKNSWKKKTSRLGKR